MSQPFEKETVLIKPLGGAAGDMFVGAAAGLWPELVDACLSDLAALQAPPEVSAEFQTVRVNGFAATKFRVAIAPTTGPVAASGAYPEIVARIERSGLDPEVRRTATAILTILGEAEASVHGKPLAEVHFHELADWDSLIDVVAAASFIARCPGVAWAVEPLPLGGGAAKTAHGRVPVPAPATLEILRGFAFHDDGVIGERVTPTGAAILRRLVAPDAPAASPPSGARLLGSGMGAGDKRFAEFANVLQLVAFAHPAPTAAVDEQIVEIAFDIDDMTGEEIAAALDRLRLLDGVLDATQTPQIGKKGRAMSLLRLLVAPSAVDAAAERCFLETTTLGLRLGTLRRRALPRAQARAAETGVKIAERPGALLTAKAESDELKGAETLAERRRRATRAETEALTRAADGVGPKASET